MASSRERTCQSQKPAISSLVSANGPSFTVRLFPSNLIRAPFELGWRPSPASITPAFTSSSLYLPMAATISLEGMTPASEFLSAFTITMNRIVHLLCCQAGCPSLRPAPNPCLYVSDERGGARSTTSVKKNLEGLLGG